MTGNTRWAGSTYSLSPLPQAGVGVSSGPVYLVSQGSSWYVALWLYWGCLEAVCLGRWGQEMSGVCPGQEKGSAVEACRCVGAFGACWEWG